MERLTYRRDFDGRWALIVHEGTRPLDNIPAAVDKLAAYEDAEEQGLLLRLPCKVGTPVYFIKKTGFHPELIETRIDEIGVRRGGIFVKLSCNSMYRTAISALGKTIFLAREEAEAALAKEG